MGTSSLLAQEPAPPTYQIGQSHVQTLTSATTGRIYGLFVKLPPGYDKPENARHNYPIIYFNDGDYAWLTATGITRAPFNFGGLEPAILVGISYAEGEAAAVSRIRDYTPSHDSEWRRFETGGASDYLAFIKRQVIPLIEGKYRSDPNRRALVGHSLGGLFAAFTLLSEPGLFSDYVISSASLWFHDSNIFKHEEKVYLSGTILKGRVFFAVGETETPAINGRPHDMVGQQSSFAQILRSRNYPDLQVRDHIYQDATHLTVFPIGLTAALRWLLPGEDVYGG